MTAAEMREGAKKRLQRDLNIFTGLEASNPERIESCTDNLVVACYMMNRFTVLEGLNKLQMLIGRNLSLREMDIVSRHGVFPMARRPSSDPGPAIGPAVVGLCKSMRRFGAFLQNLVNDDPVHLNLLAYRSILGAFNGRIFERLVFMEKILFRLSILKHMQGSEAAASPNTLRWMAHLAQEISVTSSSRLSLIERFRIGAILELERTWPRFFEESQRTVQIHFTVFPAILKPTNMSCVVSNGMLTVDKADLVELCTELFGEHMMMSKRIGVTGIHCLNPLRLMLWSVQARAYKKAKSAEKRECIVSLQQLRSDVALIPPCINTLMAQLERNNSMSNYQRYTLIVFFKKIGLPLQAAGEYFSAIYNRNRNPTEKWTRQRAAHLRRVYLGQRNQLRCSNFERFCIWRRSSGADAKRVLAKIRNAQGSRSCPQATVSEFKELLSAVGMSTGPDEARNRCSTLGCFRGSDIPFFSPLGYYYNTKSIADRQANETPAQDSEPQPGPSHPYVSSESTESD